jgi:hypothetical protein
MVNGYLLRPASREFFAEQRGHCGPFCPLRDEVHHGYVIVFHNFSVWHRFCN